MTKKLLMVLCCMFAGISMYAQVSVSGKIVDAQGPLPGAAVVVKGTTTGTVADLDGNYTLTVPNANAVLEFSYYGYETQEIAVGQRKVIDVTMVEAALALEETVVVAYGVQKKKDLTGSVSAIDGGKLSVQAQSTVSRTLEGAAPGIQVAGAEGQPGWDVGIRIRGSGSANQANTSALVVVDGAPIETNNTAISALSAINPADIASVTVLKDAASTALYGSRGANGVVLITTKSGQKGKTKISFEARLGLNTVRPNGLPETLGQKDPAHYYETQWQMIKNDAQYVHGMASQAAAEFASAHLFDYNGSLTKFETNTLYNLMLYKVPGAQYIKSGTGKSASSTMSGAYLVNPDGKINPQAQLLYGAGDYYNELTRAAFRQEYKVSASGGSDKVDYFMSVGYLSDPSYVRASSFSRLNVRSNVNAQITKWLKMGANVAYGLRDTQQQATRWGRDPGSATQNIFRWISGTSPLVQIYARDLDGNIKLDANGNKIVHMGTDLVDAATMTDSPLGMTNSMSYDLLKFMDQADYRTQSNDLNMKGYADVTFLKDFKFTANISFDKYWQDVTRFYNTESASAFIGANSGSALWKKKDESSYLNTQQLLTYNKDFGSHHIDALVGHEYSEYNQNSLQWGSQYSLVNDVKNFANYIGLHTYSTFGGTSGGSINKTALESYLARVNYIYDNRYYVSASYRRDGSSKFKKEELRWGNFWSVGGGWRIAEEEWMSGTRGWLDNLKLRASYGVTGNQNGIGNYSGYQTWSYSVAGWVGNSGSMINAPDLTKFSLKEGSIINDSLTWENIHTFDVGLDFSFWNGKLSGALDFYNKETVNAVWNAPVSILMAGQVKLDQNTARIRNRGFEVELHWNIFRNKDWDINFSTNGTHFRTTLVDVPESQKVEQLNGNWTAGDGGWSIAGQTGRASDVCYLLGEGKDLYNMFIYKYGGVAGNPGIEYYTAASTVMDNEVHKENQKIGEGYVANSGAERGKPLFYHQVTKAEAEKNPSLKEGQDILVTNKDLADRYEVGSATPDWIGGFNFDIRYKGIDFSAQFAYQIGGKFLSEQYASNSTGFWTPNSSMANGRGAGQDVYNNTWTEENQTAKFPMLFYTSSMRAPYEGTHISGGRTYSDLAMFNASYLSLKNVTLGYTFPSKWMNKIKVSSLRIFASADNTFLWYPVSGVDPRGSLTGGFTIGAYTYPSVATYNFGINLTF